MTSALLLGLTATCAALATALTTPLVIRAARRLDLVDHPDDKRKLHGRIVPLGGGVALLVGFAAALLFKSSLTDFALADAGGRRSDDGWFTASLFVAACVVCIVGLADDRFILRGRQKLLGQLIAALILIFGGLWISKIEIFGQRIELGVFALPFTFFWLLGAINALNLLDGMDALATSVGIVLSLAISCVAAIVGDMHSAILSLAVTGCLIGFLPFNYPPARIFLGDAGSMLIGLLLGALAIRGSLKGPATVALAAPTAIWAIPLFDVGMAVLRRKLTGQSLYATDRAHLHHCLQSRGFSNRRVVLWIGALCALTAAGALCSVAVENDVIALASAVAVLVMCILSRTFGHTECHLLIRHAGSFCRSLRPRFSEAPGSPPFVAQLQGKQEWSKLWASLTTTAETMDLISVRLNIAIPRHQERYHATWSRKRSFDPELSWRLDIPLTKAGSSVGKVELRGTCDEGSVCMAMGELISNLRPFEALLGDLLDAEAVGTRAAITSELLPRWENGTAGHQRPSQQQSLAAALAVHDP